MRRSGLRIQLGVNHLSRSDEKGFSSSPSAYSSRVPQLFQVRVTNIHRRLRFFRHRFYNRFLLQTF